MKLQVFLILCVLCLFLVGCSGTSQERIDGLVAFLGMAQQQSERIDEQVGILQQTITDLQVAANDPSLSPSDAEQIKDALEKASENLSVALDVKTKVSAAIAQAQAAIAEIQAQGDANIGSEIQIAGHSVIAASQTLPPPWGIYGQLIGSLLVAIGGVVYGVKKNIQAKSSTDLSNNVIDSVSAVLSNLPDSQREPIKATLKAVQTISTRQAVKERIA